MRKTTTYCDVCGDVTVGGYSVDFKWCNDRGFSRFDICKNCKNEAENLVTVEDKEKFKNDTSKDIRFLGFLRMFVSKKKVK